MLLHLGMVVVGLPYAFQGQMGVDTVKGGARQPSQIELDGARFQCRHVAAIAAKLAT
ncbi:NAD(P)H dehydrogenase (quinone) [Methylobacterium trifolii]|uniref:NAD(P)H dehydrogenase (Quinone) n=1 Tax=Methylobacterium trifolii TaxID=1003092 RepID=A0ABQ4TYS6_9HYPH|nr:NAD(P)H dehydrogenase (quinone) [Methylobacterium trifolii]